MSSPPSRRSSGRAPPAGHVPDARALLDALAGSLETHAVITLDAAGRVRSWNRGAELLTGWSALEVIGLDYVGLDNLEPDCADGPDLDAARAIRLAAVDGSVVSEGWLTRRDGSRAWSDRVVHPLRDAQGLLLGFGLLLRDLTGRKRASDAMREQQEKFQLLVEHAQGLIKVFNGEGAFRYLSPSVAGALGFAPEELLGRSAFDYIHPDDRADARVLFEHVLRTPGEPASYEIRMRHRDGGWRVLQGVATNLLQVAAVGGIVANSSDVTEARQAEVALRESEERFRLLVEGSTQVFFFTQDADRCFGYLSPSVQQVTGHAPEELAGRPFELLLTGDPSDQTVHQLQAREAHDPMPPNPYVAIVRHREGRRIVLEVVESPLRHEGRLMGFQGFARDVTREHELEQALVHAAMHDRLTGLPNRARFADRLAHTAELARRRPAHLFAVLLLDLDRFKLVNDSLGHVVGDQLLVSVARRLERSVRPGDTVTRLGGDEFAILLDEISSVSDATRVADRIEHELEAPFTLDSHEVFTTGSIGIALSSDDWQEPDDLVRNADLALYRAKARGKARYEVFDRMMHELIVHRLRLETDMRRAAERHEFHVVYQPIVMLATGEIAAFEALARWAHPGRGAVGPDEFIPVAEEMGLILDLDLAVLREACAQLQRWQRRASGRRIMMSVNLSGRHFAHPTLADDVRRTLEETGLRARDLRLEITEGVLVEYGANAVATLDALRAMGVYLQIDDFGTGYSSLSYLRRFPVDALKIDRSFVQRDGADEAIVRAVVTMAHALSLAVVAEGVETEHQLDGVRALGCDYAQGFLFSTPVSAAEAEHMVASGRQW